MEKNIFKKIMNNQTIQKVMIFAKAYHLNIDNWKFTSNEQINRILLFNGDLLVGYIDIKVNKIIPKFIESNMPFVLYTPFGKIIGNISQDLIKYHINNRKDAFNEIEGLFKVDNISNNEENSYYASSYLTMNDLENNQINISLNKLGSNSDVEITKKIAETQNIVRVYCTNRYLRLEHINYPDANRIREMAVVELNLERKDIITIYFRFWGMASYKFELDVNDEEFYELPYWLKMNLLDLDIIFEEIVKKDPYMLELIEEVKQDFTIFANGTTPVSLYEQMTNVCFANDFNKWKHNFTRTEESVNNYNKVLRKIS